MKFYAPLALAFAVAHASLIKRSDPLGIDVSNYQGDIDWGKAASNNIKFAYIEATRGDGFISSYFDSQYNGAANAGLIRGAYHFALPDKSSGATQADFFLQHGGGWTSDGCTLPGVLDIEPNPDSRDQCYGLTTSEMVNWIKEFSDTYQQRTNRYPVIYTTTYWWNTCTGGSQEFGANNPLWIARWSSKEGALPAGWTCATFWQYDNSGSNPGDADRFFGDENGLESFAYST